MTDVLDLKTEAPRLDEMLALYARAGFTHVAPPVLQPADPFLDLSGEEMRRLMYLTTDADGRELCLQARHHAAGVPALSGAGHRTSPRFLLSRPGVPLQRAERRIPPGRHRILRPHRPRGGGRRDPRPRSGERGAVGRHQRRWCGSAMPGCSRRCSARSLCRRAGSGAWSRISPAPAVSAPISPP